MDLGELEIELDSLREFIAARQKDFGAHSVFKGSDSERVKIIVNSVLGGMESDWNLIGRAMDD